ncbi:protein of unknown function [Xenorhabdus poinarii G6]|uniref:Uncharacterized protein n=1 Tax=Xenorhabdus poinarii G6 TaxID=1354304 RepID=A0A068QZ73_9GAMM|nr:protein of unknown function [Xenorhabdus poinarii G6]
MIPAQLESPSSRTSVSNLRDAKNSRSVSLHLSKLLTKKLSRKTTLSRAKQHAILPKSCGISRSYIQNR